MNKEDLKYQFNSYISDSEKQNNDNKSNEIPFCDHPMTPETDRNDYDDDPCKW